MMEDALRSCGVPAPLTLLVLMSLLLAGCGDGGPREGLPFDAGPPDAPGEDAGPVPCLEAEPMPGSAASAAPQCTGDGVCFELPLPFGGLLADVWAVAADDVWAVGHWQLQHWDGTSWTRMPPPDARGVGSSVWASGSSDVWVTGFGRAAHFDGSSWTVHEGVDGELWGSGPTDVWAASDGVLVQHWDGTAWASDAGSGGVIHGSGPNDVYVGDERGEVARWDGTGWTDLPSPPVGSLYGVFAAAPDDVWVVGSGGDVARWDGSAWEEVDIGASFDLRAVWGSAADDVWISGFPSPGQPGAFWHFDGVEWTQIPGDQPDVAASIHGAGGETWFTGWTVGILHRAVGAELSQYTFGTFDRYSVASLGMDDALAAGGVGRLYRRDADGWSILDGGRIIAGTVGLIYAAGPEDAWLANHSTTRLARWDGCTIADVDVDPMSFGGVLSLSGTGPDDVWLVGAAGAVLHWDGSALEEVDAAGGAASWSGVWAEAPGHVWLVGSAGRAVELVDGEWQARPAAEDVDLAHVWSSGDTVFAATRLGAPESLLLRWDGAAWVPEDLGVAELPPIQSFAGRAPDDAWAVGYAGFAAHYDGSAWRVLDTGVQVPLFNVSVAEDGTVRAGGDGGVVLLLRGPV